MANITDPLINQISGSDPQNLMEYIIRQRIYDSRYWKEECFGLNVSDVLEKTTKVQCLGTLPSYSIMLLLKLLQLHPEHDIIRKAFIENNTKFKYTCAIGCIYIRMTSRPIDIYETLESLYNRYNKLRIWKPPYWKIITMDVYIHQLLSSNTNDNVFGITLPRLPSRQSLQDAGYIPDGPRFTALQNKLNQFSNSYNDDDNNDDDNNDNNNNPMLNYLQYKALIEKHPDAIIAWEKRQKSNNNDDKKLKYKTKEQQQKQRQNESNYDDDDNIQEDDDNNNVKDYGSSTSSKGNEKKKKHRKKHRNNKKERKKEYGTLFKKKR